MTVMQEPSHRRLATGEDLAKAVRDAGGTMFAAGRWRWGITGPGGTVIISSRRAWPHRKLRQRIRKATGITLPASQGQE